MTPRVCPSSCARTIAPDNFDCANCGEGVAPLVGLYLKLVPFLILSRGFCPLIKHFFWYLITSGEIGHQDLTVDT